MASALGLDASSLVAPVDPPPPAGDLKAEIEHFTTIDQCVKDHGNVDPLVGDGLRAIGYDTFLRDTCKLLEASRDKDKKRCEGIDATSLKARCESMVAMIAQTPDECPWDVRESPARGRSSTCVAVAARDPRLCVSEPRYGKAMCDGLVTREEAKCDALGEPDRGACKREVVRFKTVLEAPLSVPALAPPKGKITLEAIEGTPEPSAKEADVTLDLARGVVLLGERERSSFEIGIPRAAGIAAFLAPSPTTRLRVSAKVSLMKDLATARVDALELDVPGAGTLQVPGVRSDLKVTLTKLDRTRGADVALTIEGPVGVAPRAYKIKLEATTFVRDVVSERDATKAGVNLMPIPKLPSSAKP